MTVIVIPKDLVTLNLGHYGCPPYSEIWVNEIVRENLLYLISCAISYMYHRHSNSERGLDTLCMAIHLTIDNMDHHNVFHLIELKRPVTSICFICLYQRGL